MACFDGSQDDVAPRRASNLLYKGPDSKEWRSWRGVHDQLLEVYCMYLGPGPSSQQPHLRRWVSETRALEVGQGNPQRTSKNVCIESYVFIYGGATSSYSLSSSLSTINLHSFDQIIIFDLSNSKPDSF